MNVYYVLFTSNTDAMMLDACLRRDSIPARIAPTPHDLQGLAGCGVSILIEEGELARTKACISRYQVPHHSIVARPRQINPRRDRFC